jgi:hypothetical protein
VALMIRRKSPAAREAAAGPSGGSPRESRGTGRAGAIGSQIASRRKLAIPVYVPSISVHWPLEARAGRQMKSQASSTAGR